MLRRDAMSVFAYDAAPRERQDGRAIRVMLPLLMIFAMLLIICDAMRQLTPLIITPKRSMKVIIYIR